MIGFERMYIMLLRKDLKDTDHEVHSFDGMKYTLLTANKKAITNIAINSSKTR